MGSYWNRGGNASRFYANFIKAYAEVLGPDSCGRATWGIGAMLDPQAEPNATTNFGWDQRNLREMLALINASGLCEISVYTCPEDNQGSATPISGGLHPSWSAHTAPWFIDEVARFLTLNAQ